VFALRSGAHAALAVRQASRRSKSGVSTAVEFVPS
jgi:hypothetical protein